MEEDIKYLEEQIVKNDMVFRQWFEDMEYDEEERIRTAIENLIARYKELEEENHKMKANNLLKLNKEINENIQVAYGGRRFNTEGIILKDYIPKSKVKEKIEELNKNIVDAKEGDYDFIGECRIKKQVLQELLD